MIVIYALLFFEGVDNYIYSNQMSFYSLSACVRTYEIYEDSLLNGVLQYSKYSYGKYVEIHEAGCGYVDDNLELHPVAPLYKIEKGKDL